MIEFTSEPQKSFNPITILITLGVLAVFLGGIFLYVHYRQGASSQSGDQTVLVPGLLRPGDANFEYYKTRIRVENVKATLGINFSNTRFAMISGMIVNDGDRKLDAVEMHVTLYDSRGRIMKERTAFALRPGKGLSSKAMKPLEMRSFSIGVESVESDWDPEQIAYEITGLKYH